MRFRAAIFALALMPAVALAQDPAPVQLTDSHQAQVQAATTNATAKLREQVLQMSLGNDLKVRDFLEQTGGVDDLNRVLQSAQSVGGPRWVDENTCEIRIELPAAKISSLLTGIANDPSKHPPIQTDALKADLTSWKKLKFCVVGSSAGGDAIDQARPLDSSGKWTSISESARKSAVAQARADAIHHEMESLNPIVLTGETRVKDALARPIIADHLNAFLQHQPVTRIEFLEDLNVTVTLAISPRSLDAAFKSAVQSDAAFARDLPVDWDHVQSAISTLPASVTGTASAVPKTPTSLPTTVLPLQPPDWVDHQLQAEASATGSGSRLKIGRTAEARAAASIREQFLALHIDAKTTLGDAAKTDEQLSRAIDRTLLQSHAYKVDYRADGSVNVRVSLDLRDAWDSLRNNP